MPLRLLVFTAFVHSSQTHAARVRQKSVNNAALPTSSDALILRVRNGEHGSVGKDIGPKLMELSQTEDGKFKQTIVQQLVDIVMGAVPLTEPSEADLAARLSLRFLTFKNKANKEEIMSKLISAGMQHPEDIEADRDNMKIACKALMFLAASPANIPFILNALIARFDEAHVVHAMHMLLLLANVEKDSKYVMRANIIQKLRTVAKAELKDPQAVPMVMKVLEMFTQVSDAHTRDVLETLLQFKTGADVKVLGMLVQNMGKKLGELGYLENILNAVIRTISSDAPVDVKVELINVLGSLGKGDIDKHGDTSYVGRALLLESGVVGVLGTALKSGEESLTETAAEALKVFALEGESVRIECAGQIIQSESQVAADIFVEGFPENAAALQQGNQY